MNGIRCAIFLETDKHGRDTFVSTGAPIRGTLYNYPNKPVRFFSARIFGSHSEAKRELEYWTDSYPDARIVDEVDL